MHWLSHPCLRLCPRYSGAVHSLIVVSLTNRIYLLRLLGVGFALDTRAPAPSSLASPTNHVKYRLSDTWLLPSIPGHQWHIRGGDSAMPPLVRNNISHGHKKNRKTWFGPLLCESISGQTWNGPKPPSPEILYMPLPGARCTLGSGFVHESCHAPIIAPSAQASISLFFIIFDSILPIEILHFQLVVHKQHHKSTAGPWFEKV